MTTVNCESFLYILVFDSINFLLPDFFYLHFLAICLFRFIWGFFVCFFQKKPKGQEYYLGYFGQYRPTKGQGKIIFEFAITGYFRNVIQKCSLNQELPYFSFEQAC